MFKIRKFEAKDQNQTTKLFFQLTGKPVIFDPEEMLEDKAVNAFVIENDDSQIIGFGSLVSYYLPTAGKVGKIEDIVIDENFRGRGLGRQLMEK